MSAAKIQILDDTTANKIAAGEVVERPASVVKELIENALDAGGRRIEVEITDGGLSYIRITDNGSGMSPEDAKLAVLRHATSKIRSADDLYHIATLGFRGEALPSIASVSRFSLSTRTPEAPMGTYLEIQGGKIIETRETGTAIGTTVIVKDLFYNTPARRKFLKTTSTESGYVHSLLGKLALSNPNVAFKLINNGRQVLSTNGNGSLLDAMAALYGDKLYDEVMEVGYSDQTLSISGYVAKPTFLKSSRQWQTFIVNSRVVNSRVAAKAMDNAYHSLLPKSGFPLAVLHIQISSELVDVNVHPQKSEIKFSDEQMLFRAVYKAVTDAIHKPQTLEEVAAAIPVGHYAKPVEFQPIPQKTSLFIRETAAAFPVAAPQNNSFATAREELEQLNMIPSLSSVGVDKVNSVQEQASYLQPTVTLQPLSQISDCYIIARGADGLYIVDQHAAHERILYDRLAQAAEQIPVQQLLVPLFWEFDKQEITLLEEHAPVFLSLGFSYDVVGPTTIRVSELPTDVSISEAEPMIRECLTILEDTKKPTSQMLRHKFLQVTACRAAIKAGDPLNMRQMQALLEELCKTELPYTCPHGRPAIIKFTQNDLEKMFKRT